MQMILPNCHQVKELKLMIVIHFLISYCTSETLHSTFNTLPTCKYSEHFGQYIQLVFALPKYFRIQIHLQIITEMNAN